MIVGVEVGGYYHHLRQFQELSRYPFVAQLGFDITHSLSESWQVLLRLALVKRRLISIGGESPFEKALIGQAQLLGFEIKRVTRADIQKNENILSDLDPGVLLYAQDNPVTGEVWGELETAALNLKRVYRLSWSHWPRADWLPPKSPFEIQCYALSSGQGVALFGEKVEAMPGLVVHGSWWSQELDFTPKATPMYSGQEIQSLYSQWQLTGFEAFRTPSESCAYHFLGGSISKKRQSLNSLAPSQVLFIKDLGELNLLSRDLSWLAGLPQVDWGLRSWVGLLP